LQRLAGEIALAAGRTDEAANAFLDALAKARQAGAHSYELRAAMALLRVERGTGNGRAAAERLAMLLQRFDEGGTTKDHVEGHALLRAST
jgi:predicted ATPase